MCSCSEERTDAEKASDRAYDYIKFHLGLYLATPPVIATLASSLGVNERGSFIGLFALQVFLCIVSGANASVLIARRVYGACPWVTLGVECSRPANRAIHHKLYWASLAFGLAGIALGAYESWPIGSKQS